MGNGDNVNADVDWVVDIDGIQFTVETRKEEVRQATKMRATLDDCINGKEQGGYIFLSHSHLDINDIRELRNALEKRGFDALCFYLKCLDDDSEIEGLIKREIDSRGIFLYIESENSSNSKWVKEERQYIEKSSEKIIRTVSINSIIENPDAAAEMIVNCQRVFISYDWDNPAIAKQLSRCLVDRDYKVLTHNSMRSAFEKRILAYAELLYNRENINKANNEGAFVLIITEGMNIKSIYEILDDKNVTKYTAAITIIDSMVFIPSEVMELLCKKTEVVLVDGENDIAGIKKAVDVITDTLNKKYSST